MATAKKNAAKTSSAKSVLAGDVEPKGSLVKEVVKEEDTDVIVATPRRAGELGAEKLTASVLPRPEKPAKADKDGEGARAGKPDFDAAHKALDLARDLSERNVAKEAEGDAKRTKRILASQPTTKFMVPFDIGERHGAVITVTINGYRLSIKKGVLVEIPVGVAQVLMDHLNVRSEAAEQFDLHRDEATEEALG